MSLFHRLIHVPVTAGAVKNWMRCRPAVSWPYPMRKCRKVDLLIETSNAHGRGVLQGVVRYIREHEPWSFHIPEQGRELLTVPAAVSQDLQHFTTDPRLLTQHRDRIARMIEQLQKFR